MLASPLGRASRRSFVLPMLLSCAPAAALLVACGDDDGKGGGLGTGGTNTIPLGGTSSIPVTTGGTGGRSGGGNNGTGAGPYMLPDDFTPADNGGWKLGEELATNPGSTGGMGGMSGSGGCGAEILGVVRDFKAGMDRNERVLPDGHPDFETYQGNGEKGIVEVTLGDDQKPEYVDIVHRFTTSKEDFDQWYRTEAGVNRAFLVSFHLEPNDGVLTFFSKAFFPLDGEGFGNQGWNHNYHFTTEVHTTFQYNGGETFRFTGDDDLWVFINKKLVIDLGGLHQSLSAVVELDEDAARLGIERGQVYSLDLFHAERHTSQSNFRIDTNLAFVDCGIIVPDDPR
jgi:fibro-slime domain-containing protein